MIVYDLTRDPATWTTPQHCAPGTMNLAYAIKRRWQILLVNEGAYGCYNRRLTASGNKSVHGDGRALDVGHGWTPTLAQQLAMTECVNVLAANAVYLGIQQIIYFHRIWTPDRGWRYYASTDHDNHAHIEQTMEASWTIPLPLVQANAIINPIIPPVEGGDDMRVSYIRTDGGVVGAINHDTGDRFTVSGTEWYDVLGKGDADARYLTPDKFHDALRDPNIGR